LTNTTDNERKYPVSRLLGDEFHFMLCCHYYEKKERLFSRINKNTPNVIKQRIRLTSTDFKKLGKLVRCYI